MRKARERHMRNVETKTVEGFTKAEVLLTLTSVRKRPVPDATFYRWLYTLCITPKELYSREEVQKLCRLCHHLARGLRLSSFKAS